jgi:magnesium transporter
MPELNVNPWEAIRDHLLVGEKNALLAFLKELPPGDTARAFSRLDEEECNRVFRLLGPEDSADIIEELADALGADILEDLPIHEAASIIEEMDSDRRADVLAELDEEDAEAILRQMDPEEAEDARGLLKHDTDTAGGIMMTEFLAYPDSATVIEVQEDLRKKADTSSDYGVQYAYVESKEGKLLGVLRLRDLFFAPANTPIRSIMIANPIFVFTHTTLDELDDLLERYPFWGLPVVDESGVLVGIVLRADVVEAWGEVQGRSLLRYGGIVFGEELRSMPLQERTSRRLSWLFVNMVLSMVAASVVLGHQETVNKVFALVFFMPIICNMSGCSGNQSVAVSIRELTLGIIKPEDYFHVWRKEIGVGLINGLILGCCMGVVATLFWDETAYLGVVVGLAFALNTLVAVSLGGLIPLVLRFFDVDPALGAPPILTTLTDMCGFTFVLGLARIAIEIGLI